jgi:hypothetical protein
LGQQFGIEMVNLESVEIQDRAFNLVPVRIIHKYQLIPYKLLGSTLTVAMSDPLDVVCGWSCPPVRRLKRFWIYASVRPLMTRS